MYGSSGQDAGRGRCASCPRLAVVLAVVPRCHRCTSPIVPTRPFWTGDYHSDNRSSRGRLLMKGRKGKSWADKRDHGQADLANAPSAAEVLGVDHGPPPSAPSAIYFATRTTAVPLLIAPWFFGEVSFVAWSINQGSFRQAICPARLQGRMNATSRFLTVGIVPLRSGGNTWRDTWAATGDRSGGCWLAACFPVGAVLSYAQVETCVRLGYYRRIIV